MSHLLDVVEVRMISSDEDMPRFEGGGAAIFDFSRLTLLGFIHCDDLERVKINMGLS